MICTRQRPNSSRTILSICSMFCPFFSPSSAWASRHWQVASTTSWLTKEKGCRPPLGPAITNDQDQAARSNITKTNIKRYKKVATSAKSHLCHCLSLVVVCRCLSLVVVCCWSLFVVGRCLSLFVVGRCLLLVVVCCWSLSVVGCCCLLLVVICHWSLFVVGHSF